MTEFLQQIINGISLGSVYALIALGYTMVYGIVRLINFAHGDIYMMGAFIGFFATSVLKLSFLPALVMSMAGAALLGIIVERVAYKPLRGQPRITLLITAIGVSFFLEYSMIWAVSPQPRSYPQLLSSYQIHIGGLIITAQQIFILTVAVLLMVALQLLVQHTRAGKAMRAVSFDEQAAALMGINVDSVISYTFALGSALAGAAGLLVGIYYNRIDPLMGVMPGLKAFVAAVLGGIGIIPGAVLGGLLMGIAESLVAGFLSSTYRDAVAFALLILILLVKPTGLLGKTGHEKV
ncbi:MAG: branched-chain amino acid ABC transporter permease [Firmicutes bacterium]|jgi:branched-chain amino acid transport system permease protein|nr:branched-chain amino acid ABC transporter permease [Bacillota bacterium]